jgi:hypothetical protein
MKQKGFFWHVHHDELLEYCYDYQGRVDFIKKEKPKRERKLRLKLFRPAKGKLPSKLVEAQKTIERTAEVSLKAREAYRKAQGKDENKARKAYDKAWEACDKAWEAYNKARKAKAVIALHKKECSNCPWGGGTIFGVEK